MLFESCKTSILITSNQNKIDKPQTHDTYHPENIMNIYPTPSTYLYILPPYTDNSLTQIIRFLLQEDFLFESNPSQTSHSFSQYYSYRQIKPNFENYELKFDKRINYFGKRIQINLFI